jgi:uncharacterized protein
MKIAFALILATLVALYSLAMAWLWFNQEKLLFQPTVQPANAVLSTDKDVVEVMVPVSGAQLSVLQLKLAQPKGVVFFLHGNGGDASSWLPDPDFYRRANMDVVMMDYRGYGKSSGRIESEAQLHEDVRAVWQHFLPQYAGKKWMLIGRSLGTGLAASLSVDLGQKGRAPDATMLISAYQSMVAMAAQQYPIVPSALLRYPLRTDEVIGQIRSPLWLIHGAQDNLIPPSHSQALKQRAPAAQLQLIPGAGHNDLQAFDVYLQAIQSVMQKL